MAINGLVVHGELAPSYLREQLLPTSGILCKNLVHRCRRYAGSAESFSDKKIADIGRNFRTCDLTVHSHKASSDTIDHNQKSFVECCAQYPALDRMENSPSSLNGMGSHSLKSYM